MPHRHFSLLHEIGDDSLCPILAQLRVHRHASERALRRRSAAKRITHCQERDSTGD
jgi:hypothetical protein